MKQKTPCALLINDIHISKDNISEFLLNWDEMLDVCDKYGVQDVVIGGDLWQSRSAQTLPILMAVRQAILKATTEKGLTLTIAEGNHDKTDSEDLLGYSHIFSGYDNVEVVAECDVIDFSDEMALYVMSYFPENGSFSHRLELIAEELDKKKKNILYCHQGIRGGLATPSDDELPASIFSPFDITLVGHYHNRKKIHGTSIEYIGSSRQHNFGEDEEKGYTILYTDGSYEFVKNQVNIRYKVIDIDIADMTDEFLKDLQRIKDEGRYKVKVRVSCKSKEAATINKQKLTESGANKIELVTEQTVAKVSESHSISKKFDKGGIKQEYSDFCNNHNIDNVDLGLQYLDKIS